MLNDNMLYKTNELEKTENYLKEKELKYYRALVKLYKPDATDFSFPEEVLKETKVYCYSINTIIDKV